MSDVPKDPVKIERRTVRVKPRSYRPSKAEIEADVSIVAAPASIAF